MGRWQRVVVVAAVVGGSAAIAVPLASGSSAPVHAGSAGHTKSAAKVPAIAVESSSYGAILETGAGRTLYETTGKCTVASCLKVWPPLVVTSVPSFGKGVNIKLLGDVVLSGGRHQLTYAHHPLATFIGDSGAHQTHGEGIKSPWGVWHVVSSTTGGPVVKPVAAKKGVTSTTSSSGYTSTKSSSGW